uniref:Methyltransferase domain-containing protein n=1 Tax=viral metagenome TaxID=1070528 RepID=A0A6C0CCT8_9ZZZZ
MYKLILVLVTLTFSHTYSIKPKYYYDPRIHNMGNVGLGGQLHSLLAPYATKLIDNKCYNSVNIRQAILSNYNKEFYNKYERVPKLIDLCCGTGTSTAANQLGIDSSLPMISAAQAQAQAKKTIKTQFILANAENYGQPQEFDTATLMFAFHEMPNYAHHKIIKNAKRITKHDIIILDISPNYIPSKLMLYGEPYLLNYKATIQDLLQKHQFTYLEYIPNHVGLWVYSHKNNHIFLINNLYHK